MHAQGKCWPAHHLHERRRGHQRLQQEHEPASAVAEHIAQRREVARGQDGRQAQLPQGLLAQDASLCPCHTELSL